LQDPEESVRISTVRATCELATKFPMEVSTELLEELVKRLRDKKISVRVAAVEESAKLYSLVSRQDLSTKEFSDRYGWVPSRILHNYLIEFEDK
jgi:hypothetical protein